MSYRGGFLQRTGQAWKLWTFTVVIVCQGALSIALFLGADLAGYAPMVALGAGGVAVAIISWAIRSIRCPSCGTRVFWIAMSQRSASTWWSDLVGLTSCPSCGERGETRRSL